MAVQKSKPSRSKRGMRRSHDHIKLKKLSTDKTSEELHIRHHITNTGFYKGIKQKNFTKNKIK